MPQQQQLIPILLETTPTIAMEVPMQILERERA